MNPSQSVNARPKLPRTWTGVLKATLVVWCVLVAFLSWIVPRATQYRGPFEFTLFSNVGYPLILPGSMFDAALSGVVDMPGDMRYLPRLVLAIVFASSFWSIGFGAFAFALSKLLRTIRRR